MEKLLNTEVENQLKDVFSGMTKDITMVLFTSQDNCDSCEPTQQLLSEVAALSPRINLVEKDLNSLVIEKILDQLALASFNSSFCQSCFILFDLQLFTHFI